MGEGDIAELAAGLLPGQRLALTRAYQDDGDTWWIISGTGRGLMNMGITARSIYGAYLTPFGEQVRRHLLEGADNAEG